MDTIRTLLAETWQIVRELSPWLLFGMLLAGILHVLLPAGFIRRHLGGSRLASVLKAVAAGVPLPLCSCGVIPTAIGLRKDGASKGAVTGFLISTPQTGVDSILVSATFLGWPFALFKVVSALVSGCVGGWLVNLTENGISAKQTTSEVHPSA
ncbi:MAG: permease, partial [Sedimentisphaerales bacterium]|nr:permease [Sedimentisphaerales bacterium]